MAVVGVAVVAEAVVAGEELMRAAREVLKGVVEEILAGVAVEEMVARQGVESRVRDQKPHAPRSVRDLRFFPVMNLYTEMRI